MILRLLAVSSGLLLSAALSAHPQNPASRQIRVGPSSYPAYPALVTARPPIPSPFTTADQEEIVLATTKDGRYALIPVTLENGAPSDYGQETRRKGRQLAVNVDDFPTLARTGLHSEIELDQTRTITGKSIAEITLLARPGQYSSAGFVGTDEDLISVLKGDNRLVKRLGLTHRQLVRPLFHVWNLVLEGIRHGCWTDESMNIRSISYHGREIHLKFSGKGFQESIFADEIQGEYHLEAWRELNPREQAVLTESLGRRPALESADALEKLSHIHTGDMVPYYASWYGFYEGHTDFRADPLAVALLFGLRSADEVATAFRGTLWQALNAHFSADPRPGRSEQTSQRSHDSARDGSIAGPASSQSSRSTRQQQVAELARAVRSDQGVKALAALAGIGTEDAVSAITNALRDERWWIRRAAVDALEKVDTETIITPLADALSDSEPRVGEAAAGKLTSMGHPAVVPLCLKLESAETVARARAASVLGRIKSEQSVLPLAASLNDVDWMVRTEAAVALARIRSETAVRPLLEWLRAGTDSARVEAAWVLGEMKAEQAVRPLIRLLDDHACGWMAAVSLGKIGSETAVGPLIGTLEGTDVQGRRAAAWALANVASEKAVGPLRRALQDHDDDVRMWAGFALERIASKVGFRPH